MTTLTIALVSPSGTFEQARLELAHAKAESMGIKVTQKSCIKTGVPPFLNGTKQERLNELSSAEKTYSDAIWCTRGGCGALELWHEYEPHLYANHHAPLIGYSDITTLHFLRYLRASRIGIHGPVFLELAHPEPMLIEALELLIKKQAHKLVYPALKKLNHFVQTKMSGELIVMNLKSLQSITGCFEQNFLQGKILALEEVNEPHYKVFRAMHHLKNAQILTGIRALCVGHLGPDRKAIIEQTLTPLASDLGIPLFDWPIFGHEHPNWPLLFGAKASISAVDDHFFTLSYDEQHDHTPIHHDA